MGLLDHLCKGVEFVRSFKGNVAVTTAIREQAKRKGFTFEK